jgi:hypothetical protein
MVQLRKFSNIHERTMFKQLYLQLTKFANSHEINTSDSIQSLKYRLDTLHTTRHPIDRFTLEELKIALDDISFQNFCMKQQVLNTTNAFIKLSSSSVVKDDNYTNKVNGC